MKAVVLTLEKQNKMKSKLPMVYNEILGKQMIDYCLDVIKSAGLFSEISVAASVNDLLSNDEDIFIMKGNAPLVSPETIKAFHEKHLSEENNITKTPAFAFVKSASAIVEFGDMHDNTDCNEEFILIENKIELYEASEILKKRINEKHMLNGVTIINPEQTYISPEAVIGCDTVVYPNTYIKGGTTIGQNCIIGPDCSLTNMNIGDFVEMLSSTAIDSSIGDYTHVGPYAYIRPNSQIGENAKIGDFVEVKNSIIGDNSKASHLTYVGDSIVGKNVNFGCGTITVNYDGKKKFKTEIGDNAFIGCNTNLVAPVKIGEAAYTAAGSTITENVPDKALGIARARQTVKLNWRKK